MVQIEKIDKNLMTQLYSDDPASRCAAIESLMNEELDDEIIKVLCAFVEDPDKGIRNSIDMTLSFNPSQHIPLFLVKYVSSPIISSRNLAGEILLKIGNNAVDAMVAFIGSSSDDDKKFVIDILGLIGDPKSGNAIIKVLEANKNENVILACVEALGNLKFYDALDNLFQTYEKNELYRPTIIEALGKIGSKKSLDFVMSKYNEEEELIKFSIIESLGSIGDEQSFYFLISELNETSSPIISPIIGSINELREKYNYDVPFDDRVKKAILQTIYESEPKYKKAAVYLISAFEDEEIIAACLKIYGEDFELDEIIKPKIFEKPLVLFCALPALISELPENLLKLMELTKEVIDENSVEIINSLAGVQRRNISDSFTKCLDSPDEEIRKLAVELLFTTDQNIAILFIDKMLDDDNMWNRLKLLEILSSTNLPEAESALVRMSNDPEEMISERAKFILFQKSVLQLETKQEDKK
jgi:HEAT repeat protein